MLRYCAFLIVSISALAQEPPRAIIIPEDVATEELVPQVPALPFTGVEIASHANAISLANPTTDGLKVMILGDSMALSGFADTLDECFRSCPGVSSVHTVICCGTNPLSWLKAAPYTNAKTRCGYLEKRSTADGVIVERDIYGMKKGHKPSAHPVPKIEDLLSSLNPDIIVFQSGNNFFDLFSNEKSVNEKSGAVVSAHLTPLVKYMTTSASSVKKWYWVTPPQAGNVTPEVQSFVFDTIKRNVDGYATVLDSREITSYPYPMQDRDRMHFWGQACNDWGRDTFRLISKDLGGVELTKLPSLVTLAAASNLANPPILAPTDTGIEANENIRLRVKLVSMTQTPPPEDFAPYGEFLVGYLYEVVEVKSGEYAEKQLLMLHPAYIKHVPQDLSHLKVGEVYEMEVMEIEDKAIWSTTHRRDSVGKPELFPYMLSTDASRHPDSESKRKTKTENMITP